MCGPQLFFCAEPAWFGCDDVLGVCVDRVAVEKFSVDLFREVHFSNPSDGE